MKHNLVLPKVFLCFVAVGVLSACFIELAVEAVVEGVREASREIDTRGAWGVKTAKNKDKPISPKKMIKRGKTKGEVLAMLSIPEEKTSDDRFFLYRYELQIYKVRRRDNIRERMPDGPLRAARFLIWFDQADIVKQYRWREWFAEAPLPEFHSANQMCEMIKRLKDKQLIAQYCKAPIQQAKSQEPKGFKKQPASEVYKIAILPWKIRIGPWAPQRQKINQIVFAGAEQAISGQSNRVRLEYSFHRAFPAASQSKVIDKSIVSKQVAKRIWWGGEPYLDLVIDVGKKLGVNGVLLCHVQVLPGAHAIGCHAIDVSSKRSFKAKRTTTGVTSDAVQSAIEEALEKMLNAGSARTPGSKRKAQTETT